MRPSKYFGTPSDASGNPLFWPGTMDGYPVRGPGIGALKQEEYEKLSLEYDFHAKVFKLPENLKEYEEIKDHIANGFWMQSQEQIQFLPSEGVFVVFLSWIEPYGSTKKVPDPTDYETRGRP